MEPEETEEKDTDKMVTEIKHVTDRRSHITMTKKLTEPGEISLSTQDHWSQ